MTNRQWLLAWAPITVAMCTAFLVLTCLTFKIITINHLSESLPRGIYVRSWNTLRIGDIVATDVPHAIMAHYASQTEAIGKVLPKSIASLKILAGVAGDTYCRHANTVTIQNYAVMIIPAPDAPDSILEQGCKVIPAGQVFLLGTHPLSWDSRYLGPYTPKFMRGPYHRICCDAPDEVYGTKRRTPHA